MSRSIQVQDLGRLQQIVGVLAKYGFGQLFTTIGIGDGPPPADPEASTSPLARRIRQALIELGPTYVKLGQVLSVRPDILPPDVIKELESLQDAMSRLPAEQRLLLRLRFQEGLTLKKIAQLKYRGDVNVAWRHIQTATDALFRYLQHANSAEKRKN